MPDQLTVSRDDRDADWDQYAESASENPAQQMRYEISVRLLSEDAGKSPMRLFDLGSGQGDLARKLEAAFPEAQLAGAELSESGVAIARGKVPRATFLVANTFEPPSALRESSAWATHAICSEVFEHVDDPVSFLKRSREYLAADVRLIVTVPRGPISAFDRHIGHRRHFDRNQISSVLEQAGYSVQRTYRAGFPFFNLYRLLVIARRARLAGNLEARGHGMPSFMGGFMMKVFRILFHANLIDSPFGWQMVATARNLSV